MLESESQIPHERLGPGQQKLTTDSPHRTGSEADFPCRDYLDWMFAFIQAGVGMQRLIMLCAAARQIPQQGGCNPIKSSPYKWGTATPLLGHLLVAVQKKGKSEHQTAGLEPLLPFLLPL